MAQGDWLEGLNGTRAELATGDEALASADRELAGLVGSAYALAAESVRRVEAARAGIGVVAEAVDLEDRDRARLLLDHHRELIAIITSARDHAAAKTIALQRIREQYSPGPR